jgi:hypothetical protein
MLYLSCVYDQTSTLIAMHAILNACLRGLSGGADSMAFYITPCLARLSFHTRPMHDQANPNATL